MHTRPSPIASLLIAGLAAYWLFRDPAPSSSATKQPADDRANALAAPRRTSRIATWLGAAASLASILARRDAPAPFRSIDLRLRDQVRELLAELVDRPNDIDVQVRDGRVRLGGFIEPTVRGPVLSAVSRLRGVRRVDDRFTTA